MVSVPLKAMCSNMCARPVLPIGSCTEPVSTLVKNEKTGAVSGRRQMITVNPLGSVLTVTCFSKEVRSCAEQRAARITTKARDFRARDIKPPGELDKNRDARRFEVTEGEFVKPETRV